MVSAKEIVAEQRKFWKTGATRPLAYRKEQLLKLKTLLVENKDEICEAIYTDLRRPHVVNEQMEIMGSIVTIDHCLEHLDEWAKPQKLANHELGQPMLVYEPKGVVLNITAWNFPVILTFQPVAEALAAGNTVVVKPSEISPNCSSILKKLFDQYFDKKIVAVIEGGPEETTAILNEKFDHILYTSSSNIGKIVMQAAAKNLTPVTLELGGKCPVVVESDTEIKKCAQRIAEGKWLNNGQICLAPDYILINEETKPKLVNALQNVIKNLYGENIKESPMYSRMVNQRHFDRVKGLLESTKGKTLYQGGDLDRNDVFIPPILVDTQIGDTLMQEEIFGPILPIVTVKNLNEAIEVINDGEKPLGAYLFTKDQNKIDKFLSETSSGGVTINDTLKHAFIPELPFGGVGSSGIGHYRGKYGFIELSHSKSILVRSD